MLSNCFIAFIIISIITFVLSIYSYKNKIKWKDVTPFRIIYGGCFFDVCSLLIPAMNFEFITDNKCWIFRGIMRTLMSLLNSVQVFTVNIGAEEIFQLLTDKYENESLYFFYSVILILLMIACPILTAAFILSFVRGLYAMARLKLSFRRDRYIFSELNEKSLAMAKDILDKSKDKHKKTAIIFTDVFRKEEEGSYELLEEARIMNAICLKRDIVTMNARPHSEKAMVNLFAIGENETENINQAIKLLKYYKDIKNVNLYVFSTRTDGELILTKEEKGEVKVRRINEDRMIVYNILNNEGKKILFDDKKLKHDAYGNKKISAVVVGLGGYGIEMLKALTWFCQMDGYSIEINAFDKDKDAEGKLAFKAPDLLNRQYNGNFVAGEAMYNIHIHSGIDVNTMGFSDEIWKIKDASYVFVSLGSDEENIKAAAELRMMFERRRIHPTIQAVVFNPDIKKALGNLVNHAGQSYDIDFEGDLNSVYSVKTITGSDYEETAIDIHCNRYPSPEATEESFWKYEYNYNSSVATVIHENLLVQFEIPGASKEEKDRTDEEKELLASIEHRRWNAYMRAEGYIFSGSTDKKSKNYLGKMHCDLVAYSDLPSEERQKDINIVSK